MVDRVLIACRAGARDESLQRLLRPLFADRDVCISVTTDAHLALAQMQAVPACEPAVLPDIEDPTTVRALASALGAHIADVLRVLLVNGVSAGVDTRLGRGHTELVARVLQHQAGLDRWIDRFHASGSIVDRVLHMAGASGADILAVSSSLRETAELLKRSTVPILVSPPGGESGEEPALERILLPLDGSPPADGVVPLVAWFARAHDAEVRILQVRSPPAGSPEDIVRLHRDRLAREGVRASVRVEAGSPAETILSAVNEEEAGLVALTSHGQSGDSRRPFGSVADQVTKLCTAALLLFRTSGPAARRSMP